MDESFRMTSHILSVNLEDYFQVTPLRRHVPHRYWPRFQLRVEKNTLDTLELLDQHSAKATFFVIGWLAERCPDLIKEVASRGHEIASKGYHHRNYSQMTAEEFRSDYLRSRDAITAVTGREVLGYRIADGSLPVTDLEPFKILATEGVKYDSSIRPFGLQFRSIPEWNQIHRVEQDDWSIIEVPLSSLTLLGIPIPVTGGNYFRQLPQYIYDKMLGSYLKNSQAPWHFYFHTWEIDPDQPRMSAISSLSQVRQYRNLGQMNERIKGCLANHKLQPIATHLGLENRPATVVKRKQEAATGSAGLHRVWKDATIVVPCFNEEESLSYLEGTLASFEKLNKDSLCLSYVFVDDGSSDRTWEMLHELFDDKPNCKLVQHPQNRGIAAATMTGISHADDEIVCGIDCDCSFDPHILADMIPLLTADIDMVQASPYHKEGGVLNVPGWRLALSKNLSRIYRWILHHKFASYTACFRVYRRSKVNGMQLDDTGFLGIAEILIRLDQSGAKIIEFPTVLESRLLGASKMKNLSVIKSHLGMIARLLFAPKELRRRHSKEAAGRLR